MDDKKEKEKRKRLKAPNGSGSVYKLSGRRRKPWIARITVGWDIVEDKDGEEKKIRKYQTIGYFEKERDAKDALLLHRINPISPKADITLGELYDEWSGGWYKYISASTVRGYEACWNAMSKYKQVKFKELRTAHFQNVIDECYVNKKSKSMISKTKLVAGMLYDYAIQNDIVNKNYAQYIVIPKMENTKKEAFTDLEIQVLEKAEGQAWVDTILILIYSGLRINEMLSLTRFSINLGEQTITGGLKTDAGKDRVIPIHPKILKHIKKWYDKNGEYLICNENGKHISDKMYRNKFYYPTLKSLKVRELTPHCCRHTFASLMARGGADTLAIQKIIGHANYSTTADNYTHTDIQQLRDAILKI